MQNSEENYRNLTIYNQLVERTKYDWISYDNLPEYLMYSFRNYQSHISSFEGYVKAEIIKKQEISIGLHVKINEVVMHYLQGRPYAAYDLMSESIDLVQDILIRKSERLNSDMGKFIFKARVQREGEESLAIRKDMFHIPFEKRHLISGQRFSAHGVPSVYLGETIYDCYLELGKPNIDNFWVSLFWFPLSNDVIPIKLIDLTFANQEFLVELLWHQVKKNSDDYFSTLDRLIDDVLL